jgi:hypothetical protein
MMSRPISKKRVAVKILVAVTVFTAIVAAVEASVGLAVVIAKPSPVAAGQVEMSPRSTHGHH